MPEYDLTPRLGLRRPVIGQPNYGIHINYDLDLLDAEVDSRLNGSTVTASVVNTTVETDLLSPLIPGGLLAAGDMLRLTAIGDYFNSSGASVDATWRLRLGASLLLEGFFSIASNAARRRWNLQAFLIVESGVLQRVGAALLGSSADATFAWATHAATQSLIGYGTGAESTAIGKFLKFSVQFTVANANIDAKIHAWTLEHIKA
jgi:hypothetical protein